MKLLIILLGYIMAFAGLCVAIYAISADPFAKTLFIVGIGLMFFGIILLFLTYEKGRESWLSIIEEIFD